MDKSTEDAIHESIVRKLKQHCDRNKDAAYLIDLIGDLSTELIKRINAGYQISAKGKLTHYGQGVQEVLLHQKNLINQLKALYTEVK